MDSAINRDKLFLASRVALVATAMTFAIRANLIGPLGTAFHIPSREMGIVIATAFWGFTVSMIIGGALCDVLGMKKLIVAAFVGHLVGIVLTILAKDFWSLFVSTLLVGMSNGLVEAACNPLVATLYPDQKTEKLNGFHVWFPGGIVIGGLVAFAMDQLHLNWQFQMAAILIPVILYGVLFFNEQFPLTERVSSGTSYQQMLQECIKPLFIFMVFCMFLTSSTELGTNQWIAALLGNAGVPSILLLVFINGFMAIGRSFAGSIEKLLSPLGMLLFSSVLSAIGLFLLSHSTGLISFAAAGVFAAGICFYWPTMLGFVSEYLPRTGAIGLAIMGGAGMLSVALILPLMGDFYDKQTLEFLPEHVSLEKLQELTASSSAQIQKARLQAGAMTLRYVSVIPAVLTILFGVLYFARIKKSSTIEPH